MKGVIIAGIFFLLGLFIAHLPVTADERLAASDLVFESTQRVPFDSISVYPDEVRISVPSLRYARVTSNSMAPLITDKSVVFEQTPTSVEDILVGDVISFYEPGSAAIVLHAIVNIVDIDGQTHYETQGLANSEKDPWLVSYADVEGVLVGTFR